MKHYAHTLDNCPICSSTELRDHHRSTDHTVSKAEFTVVRCSDCSLLMTSPRPATSELGEYYKSEEYVSHNDTSEGLINSIYQIVKRRTIKQKVALVKETLGAKSILDFGCGTGAFLDACRLAGLDVKGAEPDPDAISHAATEVSAHIASPEAVLKEDQRHDVISLWHVLEHLPELCATLSRLKEKLQPGGHLIVAVPNHASLDAQMYGADWAAWDVPRHLWHFDPISMQRLCQAIGLEIVDINPMWYDSVYVAMLSEKQMQTGAFGQFRAVLRGFISNFTHLMSKKPRCSSQVYLLKAI